MTSNSDSFVAWHAASKEIEVHFAWSELNGYPLGQQGMEVSMDDGGDYSSAGELPYGTLLFRVTETDNLDGMVCLHNPFQKIERCSCPFTVSFRYR